MPIQFRFPEDPEFQERIERVDAVRLHWAAIRKNHGSRLERLRAEARLHSIAASCRLSGIRVDEEQVREELSAPVAGSSFHEEILGYAAGYDVRWPTTSERLLQPSDLQQLHGIVASGGRTDIPTPLRGVPDQREAFGDDGRALDLIYPTLPPRLLAATLEELLTWVEFELRSDERSPVLAVGAFVLAFLAASPFDRFNSRMARLLAVHLLARAGCEWVRHSSFEAQVERLRRDYHEGFVTSRSGLWAGEADLQPWLAVFVEVLDRQREALEVALEPGLAVGAPAQELPPLQQKIVTTVREHGLVDAALLMRVTSANRNTLKDNLRRLVDRGILEKVGQKRGTRYRFPGPVLAD